MTAKLLHFQLRPWTPRRFPDDVRQALIGLCYQFPVLVEFFEDHNADQSARLAPASGCGNDWLVLTADSRGAAVLSADATPIGVFRTGEELRTALLPVVAAIASRAAGAATRRPKHGAERRTGGGDDAGRADGAAQPVSVLRVADGAAGATAIDDSNFPTSNY